MDPWSERVRRIAAQPDPVVRNLQITQCYYELAQALKARTGPSANWCTFAAWASKQAGQSIRKEDLRRALERLLDDAAERQAQAAQAATAQAQSEPQGQLLSPAEIRAAIRKTFDLRLAVDRAADAVARGNLKVFAEIGAEFARFLAEFLYDAEPDPEKLARFCAGLRPGEPPEGQRYLRQAFTRYYQAFFAPDPKARAEMLLCANLEIGLHEQTRLQPEIAAALDAAYVNTTAHARRLAVLLLPGYGLLGSALWFGRRLLGRPTLLERSITTLLVAFQLQLRQAFTALLMTIRFPPDVLVRLGDDLAGDYPEPLRQLADHDLRLLLERIDPTADSPLASGARDWADLPDRLHFIADLFRSYQEAPNVWEAPFTPEQVAALEAGRRPAGHL